MFGKSKQFELFTPALATFLASLNNLNSFTPALIQLSTMLNIPSSIVIVKS